MLDDFEVARFAATAASGRFSDANAEPWAAADETEPHGTIEGNWSSRWNGGTDPTVPDDAAVQMEARRRRSAE